MSKVNDGGPAFPTFDFHRPSSIEWHAATTGGMSLRDWFAGQALASIAVLLGNTNWPIPIELLKSSKDGFDEKDFADHRRLRYEFTAGLAYKLADAMIAERSKAK